MTWDALGRQITEQQALGTMTMAYDLAGRRTNLFYVDGFAIDYRYDLDDRLNRVRQGGSSLIAAFAYDDLGRRTGVTRGNGVATAYTYDGASRLRTLSHDPAGAGSDVTWTLSYNPASQVVVRQTSNPAYLYAPAPGAQAIARNGLNQPVTVDSVAATSDARGNLTFDGARGFSFDAANRLTGTGSSSLAYDPLDRLAQMVGTTGGRYLYDGAEITGVVTAPTGTTLNNRLIRGPWPDELLVAYQGDTASTPLWSLQDHQGSTIAITDATGAATFTLAYDEYGQPRAGNAGRIMYTGQLWLPDFGLYHYKARAYHPALGRFLQTDPVGYEQGMNLYAYVGLDPVNATDPDGEQACFGGDGPAACRVSQMLDGPEERAVRQVGEREAGEAVAPLALGIVTAPFFAPARFAPAIASLRNPTVNRVFWSGGPAARDAAASFATRIGGVTLEQTLAGRLLQAANNGLAGTIGRARADRILAPLWRQASRNFAAGARGEVNVFVRGTPREQSVWKTVEEPILTNNNTIRYNVVE